MWNAREQAAPSSSATSWLEDLTNLANSLDLRMEALLREHEQDFFLAYKTHMYTVQKDIKLLRMKAEQEEAKTREDTKIKALEGELDRFMTQALRLDELCKGYKKEVDKWKAKAEALDEDRRFLEDQIKGAKRQNKARSSIQYNKMQFSLQILRAAAERARSSAYTALMATKAKSEGDTELEASPPQVEVGQRPASTGSAAGSAAKRAMEVRRSETPEVASRGPERIQDAAPAAGTYVVCLTLQPNPPKTGHPDQADNAFLLQGTGRGSLGRSVLGNEAEQRYVEAIQMLKERIEKEQYTVRMLQASRATAYSHKSEMEEFFLKCIDEARKELMRKKHITVNWQKSDREKVLEAMLNNEDRICGTVTGLQEELGCWSKRGRSDHGLLGQKVAEGALAPETLETETWKILLKVSNASLGSPAVANRGKKPQRVLGWTAVPVLSAALGYCKKPRGQSHVKARADRDSVRNKSQTRRRPWILAISMLLPLLVGKPPSYAAERWDDLSQRYAPASPPVRTKSSEVEVALAKHLRERDVKIFCTWYSRECQERESSFTL
eukprot:g30166.t1